MSVARSLQPRVVSLVPAATEILRHLGLEPVAISHCCENNGSAAPIATSSIVPSGLPQAEVDRFVSEAVARGDSLYRVDEALLERLRPDLVVTQGVCEVCAAGPGEVARASARLPATVATLRLDGTRLDHLFADMAMVGEATGRDVGSAIAALRSRLEKVAAAVAERPRPDVAFVEWLDPPFLGGHWVPDMIAAAGGAHIGPAGGEPSPRTTWDAIAAERPDVQIFAFCGYGLDQTQADLARFAYPASRADFAMDARYTCQLTPHAVRGVEIMAGLLHPGVVLPPDAHEAVVAARLAAGRIGG